MEGGAELVGAAVEAVPFTHPAHVPPLLTLLRAQALFNTLVASCVRTQTPKGEARQSEGRRGRHQGQRDGVTAVSGMVRRCVTGDAVCLVHV